MTTQKNILNSIRKETKFSPSIISILYENYDSGMAQFVSDYIHEHSFELYTQLSEDYFIPRNLFKIKYHITPVQYWELARYMLFNYPVLEHNYDMHDFWHEVFSNSYSTSRLIMSEDELEKFDAMPDEIDIFRVERNFQWNGLSWLTNYETACYMKRGFPGSFIIHKKVRKEYVYAYFTEEHRDEIVAFEDDTYDIN